MRLKLKKTGSFKQSKKYIDLINQATVYDTAIKTPITFAKNISKKLANDVFLKREDLQPVFSFNKFPNVNKQLGPEMKSTGESILFIDDLNDDAFFELYSRRKMYLTK